MLKSGDARVALIGFPSVGKVSNKSVWSFISLLVATLQLPMPWTGNCSILIRITLAGDKFQVITFYIPKQLRCVLKCVAEQYITFYLTLSLVV